jgi:hypothetical protein
LKQDNRKEREEEEKRNKEGDDISSEDLTEFNKNITTNWNVTPCSLVETTTLKIETGGSFETLVPIY